MFTVPTKEWKKYVIPVLQRENLCRDCYEELKRIFPKGWRKVKTEFEVKLFGSLLKSAIKE
jgi:hypothetical protein